MDLCKSLVEARLPPKGVSLHVSREYLSASGHFADPLHVQARSAEYSSRVQISSHELQLRGPPLDLSMLEVARVQYAMVFAWQTLA